MLILIVVAFVAGVVTALSPCVLPALPVVLAGSAGGGARRVVGMAVGFVASFVLFTLALTMALRNLGLSPDALRDLAIAALIAFGVALVVPALGDGMARVLAPVARLGERIPRTRSGLAGGLLVGIALGLVWTPCAGPVFAAIAAVAATGEAGPRAFATLTAYALGAIVPLCIIAAGGQRLLSRLRGRAGAATRPALGLLMIAAGAVLLLGLDTRLTTALVQDVPGYTNTLQALERTSAVDRELAGLRPRGAATDIPPFLAAARGTKPEGGPTDLGLPDAGRAPELRGISATFNTGGAPLRISDLRGRVVLLDFWTYSCINCLRTIPFLKALDQRYRDAGLTVVGVHTPEFLFEADPGNVGRAVRDLGIRYPVVLDPRYATWDAYGTRYWPTTYLIDRNGDVRDLHVGEGDDARTEALVRRALAVPAGSPDAPAVAADAAPGHAAITPETYLGAARIQRLAPGQALHTGQATYRAPAALPPNHVALDGGWTVGAEADQAGQRAALELSFAARDVYLVLDGAGGRRVGRVLLDGRAPTARQAGRDLGPRGRLVVTGPRLYRLLELPRSTRGRVRIELPPGTRAYSFTFG